VGRKDIIVGIDSINELTARANALMEATETALMEAIAVCHAGVQVSEIGRVMHDIADANGFRSMKNICGGGVGSHLHMLPEIKVSLEIWF